MAGGGRVSESVGGFALGATASRRAASDILKSLVAVLREIFPINSWRRRYDRNMAHRRLYARLWRLKLVRLVLAPGLALLVFAGAVFVLSGGANAMRGEQYAAYVAANGTPRDVIARLLGMGVDVVAISGQSELKENEILQLAGINAHQSLPFLDAGETRRRLMANPLVKNASIRKLYPNRLAIAIVEREPYALWQKDGAIQIIAADGEPLDQFRDDKYAQLPFVVGEDANVRIAEYMALLQEAGEIRPKIRAGVLVMKRRWSLTMTSGLEVLLPESHPERAVAQLAQLERSAHILEKDVILLDFRTPGRLIARLTEEAAATRAEETAKPAKKGGA